MGLLLQIRDLFLSFPHKSCFENFSTALYSGARVAVIGDNGSGKSTLLRILLGEYEPSNGVVDYCGSIVIGYVPQIVPDHYELSGGERFNKALSLALAKNPDLLILDEPTNHLDSSNRKSLIRILRSFNGAIIAATHDIKLMNDAFNTLWHIHDSTITIFSGRYDAYRDMTDRMRENTNYEIGVLRREKRSLHEDLMKEQERAKKSKNTGKKKNENHVVTPLAAQAMKDKADQSTGRKQAQLDRDKLSLEQRLEGLYSTEILKPKFIIPYRGNGTEAVLQVIDGCAGYGGEFVVSGLNFTIGAKERIAIVGNNGSGKSTVIHAILDEPMIKKTGKWYVLAKNNIGYLDQHYNMLSTELTVLESTQKLTDMPSSELRKHLNSFLFRKNEEVNAKISTLSGGEMARLTLAHIALRTPALLILDEITNNVDLATKEYISQILNEYPCALLMVSHDEEFLTSIGISKHICL